MRNSHDDSRGLISPSRRGKGRRGAFAPATGDTDAVVDDIDSGTGTPVRRCILSGDRDGRDTLVRLVLAPDGQILPDVRAKAPGRGAWIGVSRADLEIALKKGKLKGGLARAFKTADFTIAPDLPATIETALSRNALDRLGLESRSGKLLTGSDKIEGEARAGRLIALYHAADAKDDGQRKLAQAWRVGSDREGSDLKGLALPVGRPILSLALGRENVVHIGLTDRAAAKRVSEALDRWLHFIGSEPSSVSCETASQGASASPQNGAPPIQQASGSTGTRPAVDMTEEFE